MDTNLFIFIDMFTVIVLGVNTNIVFVIVIFIIFGSLVSTLFFIVNGHVIVMFIVIDGPLV